MKQMLKTSLRNGKARLLTANLSFIAQTRQQEKTYCLQPAVKMRKIVQLQLEELDPKEYKKEEKQMPTFSLRKDV